MGHSPIMFVDRYCSGHTKRGRIYACARHNGYNVLALGQHLDDLREGLWTHVFLCTCTFSFCSHMNPCRTYACLGVMDIMSWHWVNIKVSGLRCIGM